MYREAIEKLRAWKDKENRKPLILMGARQVGKTWLMKEFGRVAYDKVAYISFFNNPQISALFESDYEIARLILRLSIASGVAITPHDTLIIFDEIQEVPKALESLKAFCEDGKDYHVIAAGSLLGVAHHSGVSFPVGKVDILHLQPLSYREFLAAIGEKQLATLLKTKDYSLIDSFSDRYLFWLKNYYYIGGMPEVVESFRLRKDYKEVRTKQEAILTFYEADFGRHVKERDLERIRLVWKAIPLQLAKENRKFFFGQIKKGSRSSEYEIAIQWLEDCGLIHKVYMVNEPHLPLKAYMVLSSFKLFLVDVGLLGAMSNMPAEAIIDGNNAFVEFKGAMTEQYVLQELVANTEHTPFYYGTEKATFEQDFLLQIGTDIVPVEVKAEGNTRSQSLKAYCDKFHPNRAIRFSALKYISQGWMENIPLYAVSNIG